jgi:transposase-like protein
MDTCKIAPGLYQYTAIDDCTRIRVLALYKRRGAANSLLFLEKVIEEFPFRSKEYKPIAVVNSLPTLSRRSSWNMASSSVP